MIVPELLRDMVEVHDRVRLKIIDPESIFITGMLGESGQKFIEHGLEFYFTRELAEKLISKGIAMEVIEKKL